MARIRTVKPDFWGHPKTAKVSRDARLLFLGLLNLADDEGRLLASVKGIDGAIYVNDDDVTAQDISRWLDELQRARFLRLYEVDNIRYCQVIGFSEHQKVSHPTPSKFPPPPDNETPEPLANDSGEAPEILAPEREQGTGNREQGGAVPALPPRDGATWVERLDPGGPVAIRNHANQVLIDAIGLAHDTAPLTPSEQRTLRPVVKEALESGYAPAEVAAACASAPFRTRNGVMGELRKAKQQPTSVGNRGLDAVGRFLGEGA